MEQMKHAEAAAVRFCGGLADLAGAYDAFLIDQWGVLHDGYVPYGGAVDCLRRLVAAGKRVVLISNSGRRAQESGERLARIGLSPDGYSDLVTSGEIAWRMLASGEGFCGPLVGRRAALFASDAHSHFAEGLPIALAELEAAGVLERHRDGRQNTYRIDRAVPLRHPLESHCRIGELIDVVVER